MNVVEGSGVKGILKSFADFRIIDLVIGVIFRCVVADDNAKARVCSFMKE